MRFWTLLFLMVFLVMGFQGEAEAKTPEVPVRSTRSLRQQVESYTEMLKKEVAKAKNTKEKYRSLNRVLGQIKALRENNPPQEAADEAHLDLLVSALESLPSGTSFKKKDCAKYQSDYINQFEPSAEESPQEPAVMPGWMVLEDLCK